MPDRVVFDTNIWLSGLLWRGKPYQCLMLARSGVVQAYCTQSILDEISGKLLSKFGFTQQKTETVLNDIRQYTLVVEINGSLRAVQADPDDDQFLECAQTAGASYIVSGDHHLLEIASYQSIRIVTADEYLKLFK